MPRTELRGVSAHHGTHGAEDVLQSATGSHRQNRSRGLSAKWHRYWQPGERDQSSGENWLTCWQRNKTVSKTKGHGHLEVRPG